MDELQSLFSTTNLFVNLIIIQILMDEKKTRKIEDWVG